MTRNDTLAAYLNARPNIWIDGKVLALYGGAYAWRTRLSELRRGGMRIENKQHRHAEYVESFYRYVPKEILREEETSARLDDGRTASQGEGLSE